MCVLLLLLLLPTSAHIQKKKDNLDFALYYCPRHYVGRVFLRSEDTVKPCRSLCSLRSTYVHTYMITYDVSQVFSFVAGLGYRQAHVMGYTGNTDDGGGIEVLCGVDNSDGSSDKTRL